MTVRDLIPILSTQLLVEGHGIDTQIKEIVVSDLMSDVLMIEAEEFIVLTSLASEQVIRTADIVGATAVVLVNGKQPQSNMIELAREMTMTLLSTPFSTYEACIVLHKALGPAGETA
jgi:predicted transcriptional regulator